MGRPTPYLNPGVDAPEIDNQNRSQDQLKNRQYGQV
jgi:hypothetical protein